MVDNSQMDQMDHNGSDAGNTESRRLLHHYWLFTLNNYTMDQMDHIDQIFRNDCEWFVMQEEIGEETHTPHIQGTLKFKQRKRLTELKKYCKEIHWEPTRCIDKAIEYCSKEKTRKENGKQWIYGITIKKALKPITLWQQWQLDIVKICKTEPDDRTIHWYWERKGNTGKTTLARYLARNHDAIQLEGKKSDILYCAAEHESEIYIYDLERSMETYVSYGSLEKIKNGFYMCSKYKSKPIDRNPPHVFVFANFPPDTTQLSTDRWHIVHIKTDEDLK